MDKNSFVNYITEDVLAGLSGVKARAMFGGYGVYRDGQIFGIIVDDELYFKTGTNNRADYEAAGSKPFSYRSRDRKTVVISYWQVPDTVLEDRETIEEWARRALQVPTKSKLRSSK